MKIAQVTHNYLPHIGGVEFYVKRIVNSLEEKGMKATVLTTDMSTSEEGRKPEAVYFKTSFKFMRNPFSFEFVKYLNKNNYDVMHLHSVWFLHCLTAVYLRKKARIIATIHGVYPDNSSFKLKLFLSIYKYFVKYILNKAEKVLVYSEIEKRKLERLFNIPAVKIVVIPMAINVEKFEEHAREKVILFTGRIIPDKNPDLLIKAMAKLELRFNEYKLVFVGSVEDAYKRQLTDLAKNLGLKNEITFVNQLDPSVEHEKNELMDHYRKSAVFVSLGSWEGQPTRLMEAMQYKTPVIAFAAGGTADFVKNEENGLVIGELDASILADTLVRILSDDALAKNLGNKARETIESEYNWQNVFENILAVYKG